MSPRAEMWTPFLGGLHQNSLKWKLSLLPTNLSLFVVNQLTKSSEVKKCTFCCLWLTEAECFSQWQSLWNACILGMSDFSHLICFYPRRPSRSTGPPNCDITFPTFLAFPSTCVPLFIKVLSAPGVHHQLGSDFSGSPHSQELDFYECERYPCNSTTGLLLRTEMETSKLSWEKIFPGLEVQRPMYRLVRFVSFLLCVMAEADQSWVSTNLDTSACKSQKTSSVPHFHHITAKSRANLKF